MRTTPLPPAVRGAERRAIKQLDQLAGDGVVTRREARCFARDNRDLFEPGTDNRWVKSIVEELVHPGTTYAYGWTPRARVTEGAKQVLEKLDPNPFGIK